MSSGDNHRRTDGKKAFALAEGDVSNATYQLVPEECRVGPVDPAIHEIIDVAAPRPSE